MAPPILTSVSPNTVPANGGYLLTIEGTFELDTPYRVHVGSLGSTADPVSYAGANKGNDALSFDGTSLVVASPVLLAGDVFNVYVQERDTPASNDTLANSFFTIDRDYSLSLWSMKALFPPNRKLGPRGMNLLPAPKQPQNLIRRTEEWSDALWQTIATSIIEPEADPHGGTLGAIVHEDNQSSVHMAFQDLTTPLVIGQWYTLSVYAKAINRPWFGVATGTGSTAVHLRSFDIANGLPGTATLGTPLGRIAPVAFFGETGWHRCDILFKTTSTIDQVFFGPLEDDTVPGISFLGLGQDSSRIAFPALDRWAIARAYLKTEGDIIT